MRVSSLRALGISLGIGLAIGVIAGTLYALIFDKVVIYGIGTMLFITGLVVLVIGILGAVEPEEGWATGRGTQAAQRDRRALGARLTREHPAFEEASPWALAIWGAGVGLPLVGLGMVAFYLAA